MQGTSATSPRAIVAIKEGSELIQDAQDVTIGGIILQHVPNPSHCSTRKHASVLHCDLGWAVLFGVGCVAAGGCSMVVRQLGFTGICSCRCCCRRLSVQVRLDHLFDLVHSGGDDL